MTPHESRRDEPVHLYVSRATVHSGGTSRLVVYIADSLHPVGRPTCGKPLHYRALAPKKVREATGRWDLDCPCDVVCPKCAAAVGMACSTPTGYHAKPHSQRVAVSDLCQSLVNGHRSACDLGDHDWEPIEAGDIDSAVEVECAACDRREPIQPKPLPYRVSR